MTKSRSVKDFSSVEAYIRAIKKRSVRQLEQDLHEIGESRTQNAFTNAMRREVITRLTSRKVGGVK